MKKIPIIRVLVVEDEPLILKNTVKKIEELDNAFQVIATAINGKEALEKVYTLRPDVVFTDIRMPKMDGIELIKNLRLNFEELPVVIISGYSDFEYLKQSIDLSVVSYLLKPLNPQDMIELLAKLKKSIINKLNIEVKKVLTSKINLEVSTENLPYISEKNNYMVFMFNIGNLTSPLLSIQNGKLFANIWDRISWSDVIKQCIGHGYDWWLFDENISNQKFLVVATDRISAPMSKYASNLLSILKTYIDSFSLTIAISENCVNYESIDRCSKELRILMDDKLVLCTSKILRVTDKDHINPITLDDKELQGILQLSDINIIKRYFEHKFKKWIENDIPQRTIEKSFLELLIKIKKSNLNRNDRSVAILMRNIDELSSLSTNLIDFYANVWENIFEIEIKNRDGNQSKEIVKQIKQYIELNFTDDISLTNLADKMNFTPAYLTKIFKKYEEQTPLKYIIKLRIDKAKLLLINHPEMTINSISQMVGYEESHYFCRIFKTTVGYTPTEYKNKCI